MNRRRFLTLGAGMLLLAAARTLGGDDATQVELKKIEGTWVITSAEQGGKAADRRRGDRLTFRGENLTVQHDGKEEFKATIKLHPDQKPKAIDLTIAEGEEKGKTALGIYALDGDDLKFCFNEPGGEGRPTEFTSQQGSEHMVVVLKREKK